MQALAVCQLLLKSRPETSDVLLLQGDAFAAVGRMDDAAATYEQVRTNGLSTVDVLVRLGETYRALGRIEQAADTYAEAVAVRPDSSQLRHQLAELYDLGERTEMAIEQYRTLLVEEPDNHLFHARLGGALLKAVLGDRLFDVTSTLPVDGSRLRGAQTHLEEAIRLRPDYLSTRQLLALLLTRQHALSGGHRPTRTRVGGGAGRSLSAPVPEHTERADGERDRGPASSCNLQPAGSRPAAGRAARAELERVMDQLLPDLSSGR